MTTSRRSAFTRSFPRELPTERSGDHWSATLDGIDVRLSNLDKVFWPDGTTKGDLVAYYFNVAEAILPHLRGRPLAMRRMPDGIGGVSFFEDSAPAWTPEWVTRCAIESEDGDVDPLVVVDSVASLLFCANAGCIDLHPFHSGCETYDRPDRLVFDIDPAPPAAFEHALVVARLLHVALDRLGLRGYAKTSGETGIQVFVPVAAEHSYDETRALAGRIAALLMRADPQLVTMEWSVRERAGKVFIDHNMNRRAASLASVYSVRPRPDAPVSTPVTWEEIESGDVDPNAFTIDTIFDRLRDEGELFAPVLEDAQDLGPALEALGVERAPPKRSGRLRELRAERS